IPELLDSTRIGGTPVLLESFVGGEPAARVIATGADQLGPVVDRLARWLTRWGMQTARQAASSDELVKASMLDPAATLAGLLPGMFHSSIRQFAGRVSGRGLQTTAAHRDLTMWNVVVRADGALGVLDWECATGAALPLTDLFYA